MDVIELTQQLIRFRTVGPDNSESDCQAFLADLLTARGFRVERHDMPDGRRNILARFGPDSGDVVCFSGHIDTVPLGDAPWKYDPFGAQSEHGRIYGRGASDMKAGIAAFVAAACQHIANRPDGQSILLIISTGEETGCEGVKALASSGNLGMAKLLVVAEPTGNLAAAGHKGVLWLMARLRGVSAHGSMPHLGVNAAYIAADTLKKLQDHKFGAQQHPLGDITLNVGTVRAGTNVNSVPDLAEITIDLRTLPGTSPRDEIAGLCSEGTELETLLELPAVWTEPTDPLLSRVRSLANDVTGEAGPSDYSVPYFTDASILKKALGDPATVVVGPGEPIQAHRTDEYVEISKVRDATEIFKNLLRTGWEKVTIPDS